MGKMNDRLDEFLAKGDTDKYLFSEKSFVTVRHEAWLKTSCLATLALNESIKEMVSFMKGKDGTKESKGTKKKG